LVNIHNRNFDGAIKKLTQIENVFKDDPQQMIVFMIRSAIYLSIQQYEQSKIDLENLLGIVGIYLDDLPDDLLEYVRGYQKCFDLYMMHPEIYSFDIDDTLPPPEKSAENDEKIILEIRFTWELISTADGSVVHTCSFAF